MSGPIDRKRYLVVFYDEGSDGVSPLVSSIHGRTFSYADAERFVATHQTNTANYTAVHRGQASQRDVWFDSNDSPYCQIVPVTGSLVNRAPRKEVTR